MTSPIKVAIQRKRAFAAMTAVHTAAQKEQQKDGEVTRQQKQQEVAELIQQAASRARPLKADRLAPLINELTRRVEEAVANYGNDNGWTEEALERSQVVCDFLLSIKAVEPMPEIEELAFVDAVVWRQFCHSLWDLLAMKTPVPRGYLNGMRQEKFGITMQQVWEAKHDARGWHALARRGDVDQTLGDLKPESLKKTGVKKKTGPKSKAEPAQSLPEQESTKKQARANHRRQAKGKPPLRPLSLSH
jgi:hypothetical protein